MKIEANNCINLNNVSKLPQTDIEMTNNKKLIVSAMRTFYILNIDNILLIVISFLNSDHSKELTVLFCRYSEC